MEGIQELTTRLRKLSSLKNLSFVVKENVSCNDDDMECIPDNGSIKVPRLTGRQCDELIRKVPSLFGDGIYDETIGDIWFLWSIVCFGYLEATNTQLRSINISDLQPILGQVDLFTIRLQCKNGILLSYYHQTSCRIVADKRVTATLLRSTEIESVNTNLIDVLAGCDELDESDDVDEDENDNVDEDESLSQGEAIENTYGHTMEMMLQTMLRRDISTYTFSIPQRLIPLMQAQSGLQQSYPNPSVNPVLLVEHRVDDIVLEEQCVNDTTPTPNAEQSHPWLGVPDIHPNPSRPTHGLQ